MIMGITKVFPKFLYECGVVFLPKNHQFGAFKELPMINEPLFIFFSILFLLIVIRFWTMFIKIVPRKSYSLSATRPKIMI